MKRLLAVLGLVLVLALTGAPPAGAHAELLTTTPGDGQTVEEAPSSVTLEFTEPVSVTVGGVRVFDSRGERVDRGNSRSGVEPRTVVVDLEDGIADGTYVVTWRVISADSHPIHGGFVFSVGTPSELRVGVLDSLLDEGDDGPWEIVAAVLRGVAYAGLLLAAGGSLVLAWFGLERDPAPWTEAS